MKAPASAAAAPDELVFQHAVEGLFKVALRDRMTPQLEERLRQAGLDLARPLAPAYPRAQWNRLLRITGETLWPGEPPERAFHALGSQLLEGFSQTLMGKALSGLVRIIGPRRMLQRMTHNLRSGCNYNVTRVTDMGPTEVLFWINEGEFHPAYVAGILEASLTLAGARELDIRVESHDPAGCTYRIRWAA